MNFRSFEERLKLLHSRFQYLEMGSGLEVKTAGVHFYQDEKLTRLAVKRSGTIELSINFKEVEKMEVSTYHVAGKPLFQTQNLINMQSQFHRLVMQIDDIIEDWHYSGEGIVFYLEPDGPMVADQSKTSIPKINLQIDHDQIPSFRQKLIFLDQAFDD